ncbi:MAG: RND family transporter, partial [Gammaproteobacteria bacterium]|nr:RND family transporter [Gammaproteobacteria bacterium]
TTLTTVAGFGSLLICDILPVTTFGLMMSVGLVVSLIVTFFLFPAILCLIPKGKSGEDRQFGSGFTRFLANVTQNYAKTVFIVTGLLIVMIVVGISRLTVENSFIDYFRESTEIYQGLKVIDQNLGGTTPLDILVSFQEIDQEANDHSLANDDPGTESSEEFEGDDEFGEFDEFEETDNSDKYWFTADKMARIMKVHDYLDSLPEIGKVLSLGTMLKIAEEFTDGKPLDDFQLALLYTQLPEEFKSMALDPYISIPDNQARLTVRI